MEGISVVNKKCYIYIFIYICVCKLPKLINLENFYRAKMASSTSSSSSSLLLTSPFISHNHGFFISPSSQIRLSLYKFKSFTLSIPRSRKISNIPANSLVNSNSVSPKPEEFQQKEPMVPPYNVLITGSTKGLLLVFLSSIFGSLASDVVFASTKCGTPVVVLALF